MLKLTPDEASLLRAIAVDRDNDLPRLVYADWLDDHGRPERAELIRLQCHPPDPKGVALEPRAQADGRFRIASPGSHRADRVAELLAAHSLRWQKELPVWATEHQRVEYIRGFAETFEFPVGQFLMYGPQLLDRTPVRSLRLRSVRNLVRRVVACGWLGEVPDLSCVGDQLDNRWVVELVRAEWLIHTRTLRLSQNYLRDEAAKALAGCRYLSGLVLLQLDENDLGRAGVEALLASPYLANCRFHLGGNPRLVADYHAIHRTLGTRGRL